MVDDNVVFYMNAKCKKRWIDTERKLLVMMYEIFNTLNLKDQYSISLIYDRCRFCELDDELFDFHESSPLSENTKKLYRIILLLKNLEREGFVKKKVFYENMFMPQVGYQESLTLYDAHLHDSLNLAIALTDDDDTYLCSSHENEFEFSNDPLVLQYVAYELTDDGFYFALYLLSKDYSQDKTSRCIDSVLDISKFFMSISKLKRIFRYISS